MHVSVCRKMLDSQLDVLNNKSCIYKLFAKVPSDRNSRGSDNSRVNVTNNTFCVDDFLKDVHSSGNFQKYVRNRLSRLKVVDIKCVFLRSIRIPKISKIFQKW